MALRRVSGEDDEGLWREKREREKGGPADNECQEVKSTTIKEPVQSGCLRLQGESRR